MALSWTHGIYLIFVLPFYTSPSRSQKIDGTASEKENKKKK